MKKILAKSQDSGYNINTDPKTSLKGDTMSKKRNVQRGHSKKKSRPRIRFSFGVLLLIFVLSFAGCFVLYMIAANTNPNFFEDEFGGIISEPESSVSRTAEAGDNSSEPSGEENSPMANPVPASAAADPSYLGGCCLITDSTLIHMADNSGFEAGNIFGSDQLGAANCNTLKVESNFGTESVYDITKSKKPSVVYIMLGSDIGTSSVDDMVAAYTTLVTNLHSFMPGMKIYVMQYPPAMYDSETVTNEMINSYNNRLLAMSDAAGVYCIDTNTALKGENGVMDEKYWSYEDLAISPAGYEAVCSYMLTHVA